MHQPAPPTPARNPRPSTPPRGPDHQTHMGKAPRSGRPRPTPQPGRSPQALTTRPLSAQAPNGPKQPPAPPRRTPPVPDTSPRPLETSRPPHLPPSPQPRISDPTPLENAPSPGDHPHTHEPCPPHEPCTPPPPPLPSPWRLAPAPSHSAGPRPWRPAPSLSAEPRPWRPAPSLSAGPPPLETSPRPPAGRRARRAEAPAQSARGAGGAWGGGSRPRARVWRRRRWAVPVGPRPRRWPSSVRTPRRPSWRPPSCCSPTRTTSSGAGPRAGRVPAGGARRTRGRVWGRPAGPGGAEAGRAPGLAPAQEAGVGELGPPARGLETRPAQPRRSGGSLCTCDRTPAVAEPRASRVPGRAGRRRGRRAPGSGLGLAVEQSYVSGQERRQRFIPTACVLPTSSLQLPLGFSEVCHGQDVFFPAFCEYPNTRA